MFTGLVRGMGVVKSMARGRLWVQISRQHFPLGASLALNGACLTVAEKKKDSFSFEVSRETFQKTSLGNLRAGQRLNWEPPLSAGDPLGGHFVLGHVDGVGRLIAKKRLNPQTAIYEFFCPASLRQYLASKGSVAVDGVSLTVVDVKKESFTAAVIPHTERHTTLGEKRPGDAVNLETDILAKHVERLLKGQK